MAKEKRTRYAILGTLTQGPASGYDIKKNMQKTTEHFWHETDSSIYPELKRMLEHQLVSCEQLGDEKERGKKIYQITSLGREALCTWLAEEPLIFHPRNELLLKLYFGFNTDPQISIYHLQLFRLKLQQKLSQQRKLVEQYQSRELNCREKHHLIAIWAGISHFEAGLHWSEQALEVLGDE